MSDSDDIQVKFLKEALSYADEFISLTGFECTPCEMLAITMAYHLVLEKKEGHNDDMPLWYDSRH